MCNRLWQVFLSIFFLTAQKEYGPRRETDCRTIAGDGSQ